jgi:hypothetical protein
MAACSWYGPTLPLGDLGLVPPVPVLVGQRDQRPIGERAGRAPGVGQQHQCQQPGDLAVRGQQAVQPAGQPDCFHRQRRHGQLVADAGRVALAENQVEDLQHGTQPLGPLGPGRQGDVETGAGDGRPGPADPLGHRRLRHPERRRDLRGGQAADRPKRQRDLAGRGQIRVAAAEQQGQRVVIVRRAGIGRRGDQLGGWRGHGDQLFAGAPRIFAAHLVHQAAGGHRDQPAARVLRQLPWPGLRGRQQRLLAGVLAQVELAVPAHQRGQDLRRQLAQQVLDTVRPRIHRSVLASCKMGHSSTGSTSAKGMSAAIASARSSFSQSSR